MPFKRLMIIKGIALMLLLMIFANTTESPSEGVSEPSGSTSTDLEKTFQKRRGFPRTERNLK